MSHAVGPVLLWETLDRIQMTLGLTQGEMAEYLFLSPHQYRWLRQFRKIPKVSSAMGLAQRLNIGFESLVNGQIDYVTLAKQYGGDETYLPEKYSVAANSRRRSGVYILDHIERLYGWRKRAVLLQKFQLKEAIFADENAPINLRFAVDVARDLYRTSSTPETIVAIGRNAAHKNLRTPLGRTLAKSRSLQELFEKMFSDVIGQYIEQNYRWSIVKMSHDRCTILGKPNRFLLPLLGEDYLHSREGDYIRMGFIESIPLYVGRSFLKVKKTSCVSAGDSFNRYEVDFTTSRRVGAHSFSNTI